MKLVLATRNKDKVKEIEKILSVLDVDIVSLDDYPDTPHTIEDGATLEENAIKKAAEIRDFTGSSALADDTGLEVEALGGAPGIYAARYAGANATYADNCRKLLREMADVDDERRTAKFRCVIAVALNREDAETFRRSLNEASQSEVRLDTDGNVDTLVTEGVLPGHISREERGSSGFGYDPVFVVSRMNKTLAELSPEEKNAISHRYRALVEARALLRRLGLAKEVS